MKHEVGRKAHAIPLDRLDKRSGGYAVKGRKVRVQHDLAAAHVDGSGGRMNLYLAAELKPK